MNGIREVSFSFGAAMPVRRRPVLFLAIFICRPYKRRHSRTESENVSVFVWLDTWF
ncbi:hypothetical protein [Paenibacillus glycinis]|uniref:Uncharacterized protein n=1 Tax=Paenibacillus glycinis TaxID=2697035 RepID=A0ABW9XM29_9BACL|nr:hypothetical protein [Paenibacillus glycinis]NBD23660.1 hypothetical protein [Paenibacillus glycinis]